MTQTLEAKAVTPVTAQVYQERCGKCRGSGRYNAPSSHGYHCFACNGRGFLTYKNPPEVRAANREAAARRKAERLAEDRAIFDAQYGDVAAWIRSRADRFSFAASLGAALDKYGSLTDGQLEAARRCMQRDAERVAERAARVAAPAPEAIGADLLSAAFAAARARGAQHPKIALAGFKFTSAPPHGHNPGAVYVKKSDGTYLGKALNNRFYAARECSPELVPAITAAIADPKSAAIAHGKQYGQCAICSRQLTDPESVARGIGPICADNMGW